jgi:YbbR domain-containing protein
MIGLLRRWQENLRARERGSISFSESLALKVVSVIIALILWLTILGFKPEEVKRNWKLELLLPPGVVVTSKVPAYVQFTLSGPRVLLNNVDRKAHPIRPDLRHTRDSTVVLNINEDLIADDLPKGVKVLSYYPPTILLRLEEVVETQVRVAPTLVGAPAEGWEIAEIVTRPTKVTLAGPKSYVSQVDTVGTEPIDLTGLAGTREAVVSVDVDGAQGFQLSRDRVVKVKIVARRRP